MCQEDRVPSSWQITVSDYASQSARWCMSWIPCASYRNQIHPTFIEVPNSTFMTIDSRKRLHIIHLRPDSTHPQVLVGFKSDCRQTDATDGGSKDDFSMEEYWFTKTNHPLRLQKNPCRCSFRRSVRYSLKPKEEAKDSIENVEPVLQMEAVSDVDKSEKAPSLHCVQPTSQTVERIADFLSNQIIHDVISEYIASTIITNRSRCLDVISTSVEHLTTDDKLFPCNGEWESEMSFGWDAAHESLKDHKINSDIMTGRQITGGYMNPTFVGSSGSIDQFSDKDTLGIDKHIESCSDVFSNTQENLNQNERHRNPSNKPTRANAVNQDYNANEKDTVSQKNKLNDRDKPLENLGERKHHQDCSHVSAAYQKKPVLMFLHGAGNSAQVWNNLMAAMVAAGYECVAPDLLGHGLSSAPNRSSCYKFHSLLEDMLKVFDKFVQKNRSAVILGHGYGCSFATAMSRCRPEQVTQLVLISGGGPSPLAPADASSTSPFVLTCLQSLIMCGFKRDVMDAYSMYHGKHLVGCSAEESAIPPAVFSYVANGHLWREGDAAFHRRITTPTLLVHGLRDPHVTLVQQCEMERTIPRSFLEVIPEAGHWAMLEAPESLSHMILCFIDWWSQ